MYFVISLLALRAGCGIWLYQFLIIAYLFTLEITQSVNPDGLLSVDYYKLFSSDIFDIRVAVSGCADDVPVQSNDSSDLQI